MTSTDKIRTEAKLKAAMKAMCLANAMGEYTEAEKKRAEVQRLLNDLGIPCEVD